MKFSSSLHIDINLIEEDLLVSKVHAEMLGKVKIITDEEAEKIINGLNIIGEQFNAVTW